MNPLSWITARLTGRISGPTIIGHCALLLGLIGSGTFVGLSKSILVVYAADDMQPSIYNPPKKFTPRARVGGTMRGTEGTDPEVQALVPDHVGVTANRTPSLNWFLSKRTNLPIRFTLIDHRQIKPLHEGPLPTPKDAGIQVVNLKDFGLALEPDVQYRWYVSIVRDPNSPSQDIVAGGVIERCELSACLTETPVHVTCDRESVIANAGAGFWYDAMGCLCSLINENPIDGDLRRLRAGLLKQVGLNAVAEWDLLAAQAPTR
jgi:hypothetical protein